MLYITPVAVTTFSIMIVYVSQFDDRGKAPLIHSLYLKVVAEGGALRGSLRSVGILLSSSDFESITTSVLPDSTVT